MEAVLLPSILVKSAGKFNLANVFAEAGHSASLQTLNSLQVIFLKTPLQFAANNEIPVENLLEATGNLYDALVTAYARKYRLSEERVKSQLIIKVFAEPDAGGQAVFTLEDGNADYNSREWKVASSRELLDQIELKVMISLNH